VGAFKIDRFQIESEDIIRLPPAGVPARILVAIFYTTRINGQDQQMELLRDSKVCHLEMTGDHKITVCSEEAFLIPAEKLYVNRKSGNSIKDITFGFPEKTFSQIWLEAVGYQVCNLITEEVFSP